MQDATDKPKPLVYTVADMARLLAVSPRTIRRWAASKQLPAPVLPGRWDRAGFDKWYAVKTDSRGQDRTSSL